MRSYLLKMLLFAGLQLLLLGIACFVAVPPPASAPTTPLRLAPRDGLAERIFERWRMQPTAIAEAIEPGGDRKPLVADFADYYRAEENYLAAHLEKIHRLRTLPGRRIIMLGGSNLAFGMDGRVLEERYGLQPVNLGLHGALRGLYQLNLVQTHAHRGDVVVFCFEHNTLTQGIGNHDPKLLDELSAIDPSIRASFVAHPTPDNSPPLAVAGWKEYGDKQALADFARRFWDLADRCGQRLPCYPAESTALPDVELAKQRRRFDDEFAAAWPKIERRYVQWRKRRGGYSRSGFNEYGDYSDHHGVVSDRPIPLAGRRAITGLRRQQLEESIALLNGHVAKLRARGVEVFFAYPPCCRGAGGSFAASYEAIVREQCDAPILFPIAESCTDSHEHFDSPMHLNWRGTCRRMKVWITALDQHFPPRVALSPPEHIALRQRAMQPILAKLPVDDTTLR